jgi:prophage antirepressor-like protein
MKKQFEGVELDVTETGDGRQWSMTVEEAAKGYGVSAVTVRRHLQNHSDEIRLGTEKDVHIVNTLGGEQKATVLYKEGVIKLGFFVRSKTAINFRQWATNLIVSHLITQKMEPDQLLKALSTLSSDINNFREETKVEIAGVKMVCGALRDDLDEVREILHLYISDSDEKAIRDLMKKVKEKTSLDGRTIVGNVRKALNLASIYDPPHVRQVINALKNMLGSGLILVE